MMRLIFIIVVSLCLTSAARLSAHSCSGLLREHPGSFIGVARRDQADPAQLYEKWLGRVSVDKQAYRDYAGGPIFDGDSTANNDANNLLDIAPGTTKTEYERLHWQHPINWSVGGDAVPNVLYRLYALEQGLDLSKNPAPDTLAPNGVNLIRHFAAPFIVLHVGTNELNTHEPEADVVADIEALVCELHHDLPLVPEIVVVSIFPRGRFLADQIPKITYINNTLKSDALTGKIRFKFVDATKYIRDVCTGNFLPNGLCTSFKDYVHPLPPINFAIDKMIRDVLAKN